MIDKVVVAGDPDERLISTSYVERQNLTMRMSMRRFTRLTNGHSKGFEQLAAAIALHFIYYNFARRTRASASASHRRWRRELSCTPGRSPRSASCSNQTRPVPPGCLGAAAGSLVRR